MTPAMQAVRPLIVFSTTLWQCPMDLSTKAGGHLWSKGTKRSERNWSRCRMIRRDCQDPRSRTSLSDLGEST